MNYFDDPGSKHFSFESFAMGLDLNTFGVINFKGYEAISKPYDFEIMLVSSKKDIDFEDMLQAQAVFTIHRGSGDDVLYNGILSEFDQLHEVNDVIFYRARLVPKLWWLTLTHHNQVFLNQSAPDFIDDALRDGGLETVDIDIGSLNGYDDISYICQYDESHFNFVSRWMERQGIYYYFDQQADGEVMVLTDTKFSHYALKQGSDLFYNPASGLEGTHMAEAIGAFTCRQKQLPAEIILKDYNYEKPSLDITSRANVDLRGRGVSYIYGEFFSTPEEGERLAEIRAEELLCQKQEFFGESTVPNIMPGFTFNMHNHYRDDFNQEYLVLEVTHEGNQSHLMSGGIAADAGKGHNQAIYQNSFKAIPNETQYRPERLTEKPKISGTIHAMIDSEVDGEYAQIDDQGRYRVKLPFDINDEHLDGKGSAPIRMMQSYAGKNRGMQFPLVKGTEVLLTFIEGNPDRPVIAGAVSNPETQGPVNAENLSESVIQTGGNNKIRMEDKAGSERIVMQSPMANSWIRVGAHNDPIRLTGSAEKYIAMGDTYTERGGISTDSTDPNNIITTPISSPSTITGPNGATSVDTNVPGIYQLNYTSGTESVIRNVVVFDPNGPVQDSKPGNGVRIRSGGDLWLEAHDQFGEYHKGRPITTSGDISTLLGYFGTPTKYNPTGLLNFSDQGTKSAWNGVALSTDAKTVSNTISNAHVRVSSMDTFNTQEGNIYDFGGYWNYNLGNSYAEDHINQSAELNKKHSVKTTDDWAGFARNTSLSYIWTVISAGMGIGGATIAGAAGKGAAVAAGVYGGAIGIAGLATSTISTVMDAVNLAGEADNIGDVIEGPDGSGNGEIKTWAKKVGSSFKADGTQDLKRKYDKDLGTAWNHFCEPAGYVDEPMTFGTTWVEKTFGDSYSFSKGNAIEISHGNKEDHVKGDLYEYKYGGAREETSFSSKGFKLHWARSANGNKHEANWDSVTGQCVGFEYTKSGHFSFSLAMPTLPKLAINISMASLDASVNLSAGTSINVNAAASLAMNVNLTAGFSIDFERSVGGKLINDETTNGFEFKAFGMKAAKEAELEARKKQAVIDTLQMHITKNSLAIDKNAMRIEATDMFVHRGVIMLGAP